MRTDEAHVTTASSRGREAMSASKASDFGHVRWPGKPTTGRYVFRDAPRQWYWQCDLHEIAHGSWHTFPTMQEAFENAMIHARECKPDYCESEA